MRRHYRPALWLFIFAGLVTGPGTRQVHGQGQVGGGTVSRDDAALVFRKPANPAIGSSVKAEVGRVSGRARRRKSSRTSTRIARAAAQDKIIARANAARNAPKPRYSEAEEQYQLAARQAPDDARALAGLGNVYLDQERFNDAVAAYLKAINLKPDYLPAYPPLVYSLVRLDRYDEAIEMLRQALQRDPNNAELYNNLAFAYVHTERYVEAVEACKRAIDLLGETGEAYKQGLQNRNEVLSHAYKNLGNAYNGSKQYDEAAGALRYATRIEPTNAAAHFNLGLALYNARRYPEAIEAYKAVVNLRPQLAAAHYNLGITYVAVNDHGAAQQELDLLKPLDADMAAQLQRLIKK